MFYVYILRSVNNPEKIYTGCTPDINQRLINHNDGKASYSSKYAPWELHMYFVFKEESRAFAFEQYLKSGSGKALAKKHFV